MTAEITKPMLRALGADITAALEPLKKKYGLSELCYAGGTFLTGEAKLRLLVKLEGGKSKEAEMYEQCAFLKLPPLGFEFVNAGSKFNTTGLNTTGSKVLAVKQDGGKTYLFATDYIVREGQKATVPA